MKKYIVIFENGEVSNVDEELFNKLKEECVFECNNEWDEDKLDDVEMWVSDKGMKLIVVG